MTRRRSSTVYMTPERNLRLLLLQMAGGDILRASTYRDWVLDGIYPRVPDKPAEAGKVVALRPDGGDAA